MEKELGERFEDTVIREVKEEFIFGRFDKLIQGGQGDGTRRLLRRAR